MGKDTWDHDGLLGWMNLLKRKDNRFLLENGERPPYPMIMDQPDLLDIV